MNNVGHYYCVHIDLSQFRCVSHAVKLQPQSDGHAGASLNGAGAGGQGWGWDLNEPEFSLFQDL